MNERSVGAWQSWGRALEQRPGAADLIPLVRTLERMRADERIPSAEHAADIRSRILGSRSLVLYVVETHLGWIGLARSAEGIVSLHLPRLTQEEAVRDLKDSFPEGLLEEAPAQIRRELGSYGLGRRQSFTLPLDLHRAGPFQRGVLNAIRAIPFGETRSYAWVARAIGAPSATRAVGRALARNPIPIIIPCHRVIASDGSLGGYGGGLPLKRRLLELEGITLDWEDGKQRGSLPLMSDRP
jgi:methylated-DNA-[protein]-cysteine S-methyltransferase